MTWVLFSIITLSSQIIVANWNRTQKLDAIKINIWRSFIATAILAPALFWSDWDLSSKTLTIYAFIAIVSTIAQISVFYLAAHYNGRVSLLSLNFSMIFTYILWVIYDPSSQQDFIENPTQSITITMLICISFIACMFMRKTKNETRNGYLLLSLIIGLLIAVSAIVGKKELSSNVTQNLGNNLLLLATIIFFIQFIFSIAVWIIREKGKINLKKLESPHYLKKKTAFLAVLGILGCLTSWAAIVLAPNPAYVKAITMSAPLIFVVLHKIQGIEDNSNPIAGSVVAISVVSIILLQT